MKLSDIVIKEEAPEGDKPIDLNDLLEFFPNTYKKAVSTLAKSGRLTWGGKKVFTKDGDYGPALEQAVADAESFLKDEKIEITLELDGAVADLDEHSDFTGEYELDEHQEVYVGFATRGEKLMIGFDVWLDEDNFNQDFDKEFETAFGEDYDGDNPDHEKIFNHTRDQFLKQSFVGVLVGVDQDGNCDIEHSAPGGFYKGIYNDSIFKRLNAVDFRLD